MQNGQTIYSNYFGRQDVARSVASITKSICALEIGVLLDEKRIPSLDLPMSTWLPEWVLDTQRSKITLRMIMNHTSGLPDVDTVPDFWSKPDTVDAAKHIALVAEPGSRYLYSNIGTSLLQPVIEQAAGQTVTEFAQDRVFGPLNIHKFAWHKDKVGHEITSGGLFLTTADLLKIGSMLLQKGSYHGQLVLRPKTLETLLTRSQPFFPYGLLFWLDLSAGSQAEPLFSARGWGGQYIVVFPERNLVAVRTKDPFSIDLGDLANQAFRDFRTLISEWNWKLVRGPSPSGSRRVLYVFDFLKEKIGVGDGIVFEPLTIARECPARWAQAQIDLGELARLRREGWTSRQLQAHFGFARSKINLELRKLRRSTSQCESN